MLPMLVALLLAAQCKSLPDPAKYKDKEGFLNGNTWQVIAEGAPPQDVRFLTRRRSLAEADAVMRARRLAAEKLMDADLSKHCGRRTNGVCKLTSQMSDVIDHGDVVWREFKDDDGCRITYQLYAEGLRNLSEAISRYKSLNLPESAEEKGGRKNGTEDGQPPDLND